MPVEIIEQFEMDELLKLFSHTYVMGVDWSTDPVEFLAARININDLNHHFKCVKYRVRVEHVPSSLKTDNSFHEVNYNLLLLTLNSAGTHSENNTIEFDVNAYSVIKAFLSYNARGIAYPNGLVNFFNLLDVDHRTLYQKLLT